MSIWGKILGGAAGFALGGPLGALIGAVAGHAVDKMSGGPAAAEAADATKQIAFTIGVIVLGAKLAKADGKVTRDEVDAFKQVFRIPPHEMKNVGRVFDQARKNAGGFEPYAKQLGRMFADNPAVLEELLGGLFHIARADGEVSNDEVEYLESLAVIFGFDAQCWDRIRAANVAAGAGDPFRILGVSRDADDAVIKAAHRKLVVENHPDRLVAQGMPPEFVEMANEKVATINAAYDEIRKLRGLR
ncbi:DnaJ domain-containing protein [Pelagibius litoralis]|uniref:DnaJ domain-containing protein n=1 Tax=Pelagibius litoralis TaxID=374515 RepID=A0A967CBZ4_9PROT|nr:TerB family tellurite resistance protein [Pelagibius litoralis]NIA68609.1 DnaJ domain-containing protein [Pelagibius litoralis]